MTERIIKLIIEDFETGYADKPNFKYILTTFTNIMIRDTIERAYREWKDNNDGSVQLQKVITLIGREVDSPIMAMFSFKTYKFTRSLGSHIHEWITVNYDEGREYCNICDIDNCIECDETTCEMTEDNFCCFHNGDIERHKVCGNCMDWYRQ